jgi:hypothetical protein
VAEDRKQLSQSERRRLREAESLRANLLRRKQQKRQQAAKSVDETGKLRAKTATPRDDT